MKTELENLAEELALWPRSKQTRWKRVWGRVSNVLPFVLAILLIVGAMAFVYGFLKWENQEHLKAPAPKVIEFLRCERASVDKYLIVAIAFGALFILVGWLIARLSF